MIASIVAAAAAVSGATSVTLVRIPGAEAFSAQVYVRGGSGYEAEAENGISHLLEHLLFRDGAPDARAERAGCVLNGTTYREVIRFTCDGPGTAWREGVASLADLLRPLQGAFDIAKEVGIIEQEIAETSLDPLSAMAETLAPGKLPHGSPDRMRALSPDRLRAWYRQLVCGENLTIVLAGNLPEGAEAVAAKEFAFLEKGARMPTAASIANEAGSMELGVAFGVSRPAPGIDRLDEYAAWLAALSFLAGEGGLAAELGLKCRASFGPSSSGSMATVAFEPRGEPKAVKEASLGALDRLAAGLTQEQFEFVKTRLTNQFKNSLKNPREAAALAGIGRSLRGLPLEERLPEAISRLTSADANRAALALAKAKEAIR
jgi:predicted Zn-dependent peptidase